MGSRRRLSGFPANRKACRCRLQWPRSGAVLQGNDGLVSIEDVVFFGIAGHPHQEDVELGGFRLPEVRGAQSIIVHFPPHYRVVGVRRHGKGLEAHAIDLPPVL